MKAPRFLILLAMFLAATMAPSLAGPPRVFSEPAEGVAHARNGEPKKLILFLLVENFAPESKAILDAVNAELAERGGEFVIVRCRHESAEHRRLFQERFAQDPSRMPLGVVADTEEKLITGTNGKSPEAYRLMLRVARMQSGLEKDPEVLAEIRREIEEGDRETISSVFGMKKSDLEPQRVALIAERVWTLQDGTTLLAALLEGRGSVGVFLKPDGGKVELEFAKLSAPDIAFLGQRLGR